MNNHNNYKKIAVINDIAGFGRCALSVAMPVISSMGIQCCPVPTAVFSNNSAFESFYAKDLTDDIEPYCKEWEKIGLRFDGILTGFYSSEKQIDLAGDIVEKFSKKDTIVIVDPIMGDNGKMYACFNTQMCDKMSNLASMADILTPNITELCALAKISYRDDFSYNQLAQMCSKLKIKDEATVIVTGIERGSYISNMIYKKGDYKVVKKKKAGEGRCGTGDVFSSIIAANAVKNKDVTTSVRQAADFVCKCIKLSNEYEIPKSDGVCFESLLKYL